MKKQQLNKLREKTNEDLQKQVVELRKKVLQITPRMSVGEVKDLKEKRKYKKEIAQILTIMREKELKGKEATK